MSNLSKLPTWADKDQIYAVVETPRGSKVKLEFDGKLHDFTLAKPLFAGLTYPYDWGFIPSTKAEDGDPLDVLIIHDAATYPGMVLNANPSEYSKSSNLTKAKMSAMIVSLRCQIGLHSRETCRTFEIFPVAPSKSWNISLLPPMRWRIRSWNFLDGAARARR
jgi:hypothetical protein